MRRPNAVCGRTWAALLVGFAVTVVAVPSCSRDPASASLVPESRPSASAANLPLEPSGPVILRNATRQSGIAFVHTHGGSGRQYIVETVTAGLALFDYDSDGLIDVYFVNGAPLEGTPPPATPPRSALYRNLGGFRFADVTAAAGVVSTQFGLGVTAGDYDNDGDPDLYVSNYGPNILFRNNGDGTFAAATAEAGVERGDRVGAGVSFLDADADGDLDLFAANYIKFAYALNPARMFGGFLRYPGPGDFEPDPDTLFRNNGDGTFSDVTDESGIGAHAGSGMGGVSADFDNDGDTDIFVANDVAANFLYRNDGMGHFDEVGLEAGVAYNFQSVATGSMGADSADYDNDGWLDIFMTAYQGELPVLYRNLGDGLFEDVTVQANAGTATLPYINWGVGFADFDCDGDKDVYIANGHLEEFIDRIDSTTAYAPPNTLLLNNGDGKFTDISASAGDGMAARYSSRGIGLDDLDNDGRIDVVVLNSNAPATILRNESVHDNHWIKIALVGTISSRDAVGSRVRVVAGGVTQIDEVHSGRGYQSHHGSCLHFGIGASSRIDRIEVNWLGGGQDVLTNVPADQSLVIVQSGENAAK